VIFYFLFFAPAKSNTLLWSKTEASGKEKSQKTKHTVL
jgi:hypothetical protein